MIKAVMAWVVIAAAWLAFGFMVGAEIAIAI